MKGVPGWTVVGCGRCDSLWLLEGWKHGYNNRATCPVCGKEHRTEKLQKLAEHEDRDGAAEIRSRMLAYRAGADEEYASEPAYAIQGEIVEEQREALASAEHIDFSVRHELFEKSAEAVFEEFDGAFENEVGTSVEEHREKFSDEAESAFEELYRRYEEEAEELLEDDESADPGPFGGPVDENPGVSARRSDLPDDDVRISDPETGPRAHQALLAAGLDELLIEALDEIPGERTGYANYLQQAGAVALDGYFAETAGKAAAAIDEAGAHDLEVGPDGIADPDDDLPETIAGDDENDPVAALLELANSLGTGMTSDGIPTSTDDVELATPPVFASSRAEPRISVELTGAFFERDRSQREDVLDLLTALGWGCEVVIVPTTVAATRLYKQHRDQLPAGVTERLNPRRGPPAHVTDGRPQRVEERVSAAKEHLAHDGTKADVLRALRDADAQSLTYEDLRELLGLKDSHPRVIASRLEDYGLVERIDRPDGHTALSLLSAGTSLLDDWRAFYGEETTLSDYDDDGDDDRPPGADPDSSSGADRYASPKNHLPCRVSPTEVGETPPETPGRAAATAADTDRTDRYEHGAVDVNWMDPAREAAVFGSARSGEVSLLNAELHRELDRNGDGRAPSWGYDERRDALVVGAEYHGPLQYWASIARALADPKTWRRVLGVGRVGEELEELTTNDVEKLRQGECIGWLPDEAAEDYGELVDNLREAYYELGEATQPLKTGEYQDRDDCRGEVLSMAQGLAGTMSDMLKLADVEVIREVRIPRFSDDFSAGGHVQRRRDLCKTVSLGAAIASTYDHCNAYRQLLEDRPKKVSQALEPHVDAEDPFATMHGSFVIAGHGVEDLEDELRSALSRPKEIRDDAPEIATKIPVRAGYWPTTTRRTARKMGREKNIEPGHREIAALHGFANDPYAVAEAMAKGLQREGLSREMYLDEVRTALASLRPIDDADRDTFARDRLLRGQSKGPRSGVRILLRADQPISQAEIERRGGCSTQSWRNHRDALEAAGLVEETPEGWRLTLPFHSERYEDDEEVAEPWILDPREGMLTYSADCPADVVEELANELGKLSNSVVNELLTKAHMDSGPPYDEPLEAIGAGVLTRFVDATFYTEPEPPAALLGPDLKQVSIRELESVTDPPKISYGAD